VASSRHRNRPWEPLPDRVLVHLMLSVDRVERTRAWLIWNHLGTPRSPEGTLRVDYSSDAKDQSLEAVEDILQTMLKQLRRQRELREATKN